MNNGLGQTGPGVDFSGRLGRLYELMHKKGIDTIVYGQGSNFYYFTGINIPWERGNEPREPTSLVVISPLCEPTVLIPPAAEQFVDVSPYKTVVVRNLLETAEALRAALFGKRIGLSHTSYEYLEGLILSVLTDASLQDAEKLGRNLRIVKDSGEIERLKQVAVLTDNVMKAVSGQIRPGVTRRELQDYIQAKGLELGAAVIGAPAAIFTERGVVAEDPLTYPLDKGLVNDTCVTFKFGFVKDEYCSDHGRSFYVGDAPPYVSGAYAALEESHSQLIEQIIPGKTRVNQLFDLMESALDRRGYGDYLRARLPNRIGMGRQVGIDPHEDPWLKPDNNSPLQPGMVMAIEPKLWLPGEYYLRLEDIVLITDVGAEFLTRFDRREFIIG